MGKKCPTGIPAAVNGLVAAPMSKPSSGATTSTVMPGVPGSEIVAITSPSRITEPAETNMSSRPPSPARSQWEPLASIRNRGRSGFPSIIRNERNTFNTPCMATFTDSWSRVFAPPPSYVTTGISRAIAALRSEPDGGFESSIISIPNALASIFEPAWARFARIWGMFDLPFPALCKSTIASASENKYFHVWAATRFVVEPLGSPGKWRLRSRPSGKYLDLAR